MSPGRRSFAARWSLETRVRTARRVSSPKPFVLSGVLSIPADALPVAVYVKKPGKSYWSYSSNRLTYNTGVAPATANGTNWWYRYTPTLRGTHSFYMKHAGDATHFAATSRTMTVSVR